MNYAIILAAGKGIRSGYDKHKALLLYKKIPIYMYSLNTFFNNNNINKIILVMPPKQKFKINKKFNNKVFVCEGDENNRQQSLINAMNLLKQVSNHQPEDVIITHDAARPFITNDLINNHIVNTKKYGYSTTLYPINDSMCEMKNNKIAYINRTNKYVIQTPQSLLFKN
jgi:2-C-methyl-D-erythritol 4-phosphate cytidylyltransferase